MTNLEKLFYAGVIADAGVQALLGAPPNARLYFQTVAQNPVYPAAAYQRAATKRLITADQSNPRWMGAGWARFQLTILDTDDVRLIQVMDALRASLKTFDLSNEGTSPDGQAPNFVVSEYTTVQPATKPPVYIAMLDANCFFRDVN